MATTTCQVCGRPIKSKNGIIAHHGYKRPFEGWQTSSCEGARYAPYEVSCERLIEVATMVEKFVASQGEELASLLATPPQTITVFEKRGSYGEGKEVAYKKPEAFNKDHYYGAIPRTYENAYDNRKYEYERTIKAAKTDLSTMQRRIREWEPTPDKVAVFVH